MPPQVPEYDVFREAVVSGGGGERASRPRLIPIVRRLLGDALTPVLAYRRLVRPDARLAASFLFESVVGGENIARYSFLGSRPIVELTAHAHRVTITDHRTGQTTTHTSEDPLGEVAGYDIGEAVATADLPWAGRMALPDFTGGWVGYAGYDTVRYLEPDKVAFDAAPPDDRGLADLHFALYLDVVAFDHVQKTVLVITHAEVPVDVDGRGTRAAYDDAVARLDDVVTRLSTPYGGGGVGAGVGGGETVPPVHVALDAPPPPLPASNMGEGGYGRAVEMCKRYIAAGDAFQIVPSQRFELRTRADPFDVYRALRVVNPSPYMFYLQAAGSILVGSSPEILCRVEEAGSEGGEKGRTVISRPLAGTRRRGGTAREDAALERELLADPKERAEHVMLVDLHRNDVGRVAVPGTVRTPELLVVERYSHVMHISSEVRGTLRPGLTAWDALRVSLPVGTVSGAPKVRAMQIIDEVEPTRRGPYGGAVGYADLAGHMDMAIALRTMVVTPGREGDGWIVHIQAGGGIVADSDPMAEHAETLNKAAALAKAVELAERLFAG